MAFEADQVVVTEELSQLLVTLDKILTPVECTQLIQRANTKGWKESPPSGGGNGRTGREAPRTNSFSVIHDQALADLLWNRIKPYVQEDLTYIPQNSYIDSTALGKEWYPVGVVDKIRFYKYEVGEEFPEHVDYKSGRNITRYEKDELKVWIHVKLKLQTFCIS
jgi:hypothetical protein